MPPDAPAAGGLKLITPVVRQHRRTVARVLLWSAVGAAPSLASGILVAAALDRGFLAGRPGLGLWVLASYGAALVLGAYAGGRAIAPMAAFVEATRDHLVASAVRGGLHEATSGATSPRTDMATHITTQSETVRQLMATIVLAASSAGLLILAAGAGFTAMAPSAGLALLPIALFAGLILLLLSRLWQRRYAAALTGEENLAATLGRVLPGLRDVAACAATEHTIDHLDRQARRTAVAAVAVADVSGARIFIIGLAGRLPLLSLLILAPTLLSHGTLTTGEVVGAATYLITGVEPAWRAVADLLGNRCLEVSAVLTRLSRHSHVPALPEQHGTLPHRWDLTARDLTFRYGPRSTPVLHHADLHVSDGERLLVTGPSGIGKSTLMSILAGLEPPQHGTVEIGGVDVARIPPGWLRRTVVVVPQEAYVFAGSVGENLTYLAPAAARLQIDEAVTALGLKPLVRRLGGYGGALRPDELSAGERQLIALARVYLSPARIVILDEATSHLDLATEELVEAALCRKRATVIAVAHRSTPARAAWRVVALDGGRLVTGTE